ncbi:sec-independent protein translocase protein TatA [Diaminobutyricimonas aerilata]|uniref:Sec-independent protein translocase protein TatA n=1 Tax=Diaminobutyricimonas aerilata TaxID=1162967 RepID=A0A2M9CJT6_9MICO|nr:Sec-independent protein translocase subunit TatA [Diaminobutyricimonas aerilata]PJJ72159.1 sec-independent protein translocase protein TatA [Diaminobutyricimonas aerilata]
MLGNLTGWHLLVIVLIVLLLFGAPKLPQLARSLGQSMRIFRKEVKTMNEERETEAPRAADSDLDDPYRDDAAPRAARPETSTRANDSTRPKP